MNSSLYENWCISNKKGSTDISNQFFIVGPWRHSASVQKANVFLIDGSVHHSPNFKNPSADNTYAVGITIGVFCYHGYKLNGPTYETCTHLGIWRQSYRQTIG